MNNELRRPDGALLRWGAFGSGAAVIFVPGLGGDSRCWGAVPHLVARAGREVVLYDPRGLGVSTLGSAPAVMETLCHDLLALVQLQQKPVTLFGWSMGAQLAVMTALQDGSSMVKSLVLAALATDHKALAQKRPEIFAPLCDAELPLEQWCRHMAPFLSLSAAGEKAMLLQLTGSRDGLALHQNALARGPEKPLNFEVLSCPVAALIGEEDKLIPQGETLSVALKAGWNVKILPEGHGMIYQRPAEVAQWVADHVQ